MRRWRISAWAACAGVFLLGCPSAPWAAQCDEYNPAGPASGTQITLDSSDFVDRAGDEMRTFIETGSLGKVAAAVVSAEPVGIVLGLSAVPQLSQLSRTYGEELKGIAVTVTLRSGGRNARIVIDVRQVCATHFRNTFLYY